MSSDGLFFRWFAALSPHTSVPVRAALLTGTWISLLALSGNYDRLTDYALFALCIFYVLNAAAVLLLRRQSPDAERPYRVPLFLPVIFILLMSAILINTLLTATLQSLIGLSFIALGIPFYRYWASRTPEKIQ
jgi:basic amino acid/polyamine antiporter, APA family